MKTNHLKLALAALCALCAPAFSACTPDTGIEVTTVKRTSDVSIKRSTINRADLEMSADNWKPVSAAEQTILPRNPFRGYTDTIMAENLRRLRAMEEQREADVLVDMLARGPVGVFLHQPVDDGVDVDGLGLLALRWGRIEQ